MARIIAVDDDDVTLEVMSALLRRDGHDVRAFNDGESGVKAAIADPPDIVLCDVGMPGMDGFGVLAALRANPGTEKVPFVFVTSHNDRETYRMAMRGGVADFVFKPFTGAMLKDAITENLEKPPATVLPTPPAAAALAGAAEPEAARAADPDVSITIPIDGTVMHIEIAKSTLFSEQLQAAEWVELVGTFRKQLAQEVQARGGQLVGSDGPAFVAAFDTKSDTENPDGLRALLAAVNIVYSAARVHEWKKQRFPNRELPPFAVAVGLHTGEYFLRSLTKPDGTQRAAIRGDVVVAASGLEQCAKDLGWSIAASREVVRGTRPSIELHRSTDISLSDIPSPIRVYEVVGLAKPDVTDAKNDAQRATIHDAIQKNAGRFARIERFAQSAKSAPATTVPGGAVEAAPTYSVAVVGFSPAERGVLGSIFGLSARRNPRFVSFVPAQHKAPDMFLVDGADPRCEAYLKAIAAKSKAPIVIAGSHSFGTGHALISRPLQWANVLQKFDETLHVSGNQKNVARATERVLVVDDSLPVRKFMEAKLAPFGFSVDYAETGEQAVEFTSEKRYTCVFLDVILPGMDGYQVCKSIKSTRAGKSATKVVMLTSKSSPFDKIRGTMAGCDAYLTKPVDEEALLAAIAKFIPQQALEEAVI
jgi:two-component system, cell cycle response regulator